LSGSFACIEQRIQEFEERTLIGRRQLLHTLEPLERPRLLRIRLFRSRLNPSSSSVVTPSARAIACKCSLLTFFDWAIRLVLVGNAIRKRCGHAPRARGLVSSPITPVDKIRREQLDAAVLQIALNSSMARR
jgi:hypothetical protein